MFSKTNWQLELSEYLNSNDKKVKNKAKLWMCAIGLQYVDGLKPSAYLVRVAKSNIENKINIDEAKKKIDKHYNAPRMIKLADKRTEEADKVAVNIVDVLSDDSFIFEPNELFDIHKKIFSNIFEDAGKCRKYDFYKNEEILEGDTVTYSHFSNINKELKKYFEEECKIKYKSSNKTDSIRKICNFIPKIWKVHPFCEGNTRATAVFLIKYLRKNGYNVKIDIFTENSWYFRNALVRATYENKEKNIVESDEFIKKFISDLIANSKYKLKNQDMMIN